jgi:uncharacterized membrane protein YbhN (UPF0104 family)/tRNA A-37 threonylcarbamoyl transferase component Bud32
MTDDASSPHAEAFVPTASVDTGSVQIVDAPRLRIHRPSDFINLAAALVGIVLVLLLGAYASGTTAGITSDVQGIAKMLRSVLVAPTNVLEGILTFGVPAAVVITLFLRREPRRIVESLAALALGIAAALVAAETTRRWGTSDLIHSLSITTDGVTSVTMPAYLAGLAAMLTTAGRRRSNRAIATSWTALWIGLAIAVIGSLVTVSAAFVTVLIGRALGLTARYVLGSANDRAYGSTLVEAIRRAGFEAKRLSRIDPDGRAGPGGLDPVSVALGHTRQGRVYDLVTREGHRLIAVALDGDQQVTDTLSKLWRTGRLRGLDSRPDLSLRNAAEGTALVSHAARAAGVRTPRVLGMAQSRDTMVLIYQRPTHCKPLSDLAPDEVSDELLDAIWAEVLKAHRVGITHRAIWSETVLVGRDEQLGAPEVWLTSWEMGEVASGALSRRLDVVQVIAMMATKVGAKRSVDAAFRSVDEAEISASAPFLQAIVLPRPTRVEAKAKGRILDQVREAILERLPEAPAEPEKLTRFGLRTVLTFVLVFVAALIILTTFKAGDVMAAIRTASPFWAVIVFAWAILSFVGAAMTVSAFSPVKLKFMTVVRAQITASYVSLAAPAGVGHAAVNLRLLTRKGVPRALGVATVALVQVSAFVTTILGLIVLSLVTGSTGTLASRPSRSVLLGVGAAAAAMAIALALPRIRTWIFAKIMPTIRQTLPRLVQILGQPWRFALALVGNLILTASYIGAFDAALRAFGYQFGLMKTAVLYLLSNAAGSLFPTPGGVGGVEGTLAAGLTAAGIPVAIAGSVVVLYRALTYWARVPLGYVAMRIMQAKKEF